MGSAGVTAAACVAASAARPRDGELVRASAWYAALPRSAVAVSATATGVLRSYLTLSEEDRIDVAPRGTYRQIADELRALIREGELVAGAMVPSEMGIADRYSVSRGTARSALAALVSEGLIEVLPGLGRRVVGDSASPPPTTAWGRVASALRERLARSESSSLTPLPSEAELVSEFGVSRNTVRRAYKQLVDEGLVVIRHGAGAFPAPR